MSIKTTASGQSGAGDCSTSSKTPKTDAVVASIIPPYLRSCHTTRKIAGHAEEMEEQLNQTLAALKMLYDAADVYAADQSQAKDERIGLVQPITAEDGRALNEALVVAGKILENAPAHAAALTDPDKRTDP